MSDVHSPEIRSYNMSRIREKDTKPELIVRQFLFNKGFRYRLYDKSLPGKPDVVLPKYKTVIFIHGCFWHGHEGCKYFVIPKTRTDWWLNKINRSRDNDEKVSMLLKEKGWSILTIWECELRDTKRINILNYIYQTLKQAK
jgi:DNA mismatch endonuclease (patch repair protein)